MFFRSFVVVTFFFFQLLSSQVFSADSIQTTYDLPVGQADKKRLNDQHEINLPYTLKHLEMVKDWKGKTVYDVGCGPGDMIPILARLVGPQGRVIGLDIHEEQLVLARQIAVEHNLGNVEFIQADITSRDFFNNNDNLFESAHVVFTRFILMHQIDEAAVDAIQNIRGLLKRGGQWLSEETMFDMLRSDYCSDLFCAYRTAFIADRNSRKIDPFLYRKLYNFSHEAGFSSVQVRVFDKKVNAQEVKQTFVNQQYILKSLLGRGFITQEMMDDWALKIQNTPEDVECYFNGLHCLSAVK